MPALLWCVGYLPAPHTPHNNTHAPLPRAVPPAPPLVDGSRYSPALATFPGFNILHRLDWFAIDYPAPPACSPTTLHPTATHTTHPPPPAHRYPDDACAAAIPTGSLPHHAARHLLRDVTPPGRPAPLHLVYGTTFTARALPDIADCRRLPFANTGFNGPHGLRTHCRGRMDIHRGYSPWWVLVDRISYRDYHDIGGPACTIYPARLFCSCGWTTLRGPRSPHTTQTHACRRIPDALGYCPHNALPPHLHTLPPTYHPAPAGPTPRTAPFPCPTVGRDYTAHTRAHIYMQALVHAGGRTDVPPTPHLPLHRGCTLPPATHPHYRASGGGSALYCSHHRHAPPTALPGWAYHNPPSLLG